MVTPLATALRLSGPAPRWPAGCATKASNCVPVFTYRTGPYAPSGFRFMGGLHDYIRYVNEVQGGVERREALPVECETAYTIERGIECYERLKHGYERRADRLPLSAFQRP